MTREDALKKALAICAARGINAGHGLVAYERGPGIVGLWKAFFYGQKKTRTWIVLTNMDRKGGNNVFEFDAATGKLISDKFISR